MTDSTNPWARRIPRTALEWVDHDIYFAQKRFEWAMEHLPELVNGDPREHHRSIEDQINRWVNVYLWEAVRRYAPEVADEIANSVADACEAGDVMGEWLWDWKQQRERGEDLLLPFEGS